MTASHRRWLAASLRECFRPLVVGYVLVAIAVDAMRAYSYWPDLDIPMHYVGALVLTYVIHRGARHAIRFQALPPLGRFAYAMAVFSMVCTASMFWELGEFMSDRYVGTHAQLGLADTMSDMLIDVLGTASFLLVWLVVQAARR